MTNADAVTGWAADEPRNDVSDVAMSRGVKAMRRVEKQKAPPGTWRYRTERREVAFIFRDDSSNEGSSDEAAPL